MERSRTDFFLNDDTDVKKVSRLKYAAWNIRGLGEREELDKILNENTRNIKLSVIIIIIIGIQPLGRFGQRPELSQSTGIALVCCILGKFLGVVCHCFPPYQ